MFRVLTIIFYILSFTQVNAQIPCGPLDVFEERITSTGKILIAIGISGDMQTRLYVNPNTKFWAMLQVDINKIACVTIAGNNFDFIPLPKGDEGA